MSATAPPASTSTPTTTSSLRRRAAGVAAAVLACVLIWAVGELAGVDFTVEYPEQPAQVIGPGAVVTASLGAALLGWAALAVLERLTRRAAVVWTVLAVVVALISLAPVFGTEATGGAKLTLGAMHLAVAAALILLLPTRRR
ncbi:DUF6069 family protein [Micromonospora sp. NPDC094482]|uniref:DUF6069 family protein n=1 Tax=unclassified Micromonospora TaxID=2617518 RepID=UPI00331AD2B4